MIFITSKLGYTTNPTPSCPLHLQEICTDKSFQIVDYLSAAGEKSSWKHLEKLRIRSWNEPSLDSIMKTSSTSIWFQINLLQSIVLPLSPHPQEAVLLAGCIDSLGLSLNKGSFYSSTCTGMLPSHSVNLTSLLISCDKQCIFKKI